MRAVDAADSRHYPRVQQQAPCSDPPGASACIASSLTKGRPGNHESNSCSSIDALRQSRLLVSNINLQVMGQGCGVTFVAFHPEGMFTILPVLELHCGEEEIVRSKHDDRDTPAQRKEKRCAAKRADLVPRRKSRLLQSRLRQLETVLRRPWTGVGLRQHHDYHHRHLMGEVEAIEFTTYTALVERFIGEVHELWRIEDEEE